MSAKVQKKGEKVCVKWKIMTFTQLLASSLWLRFLTIITERILTKMRASVGRGI